MQQSKTECVHPAHPWMTRSRPNVKGHCGPSLLASFFSVRAVLCNHSQSATNHVLSLFRASLRLKGRQSPRTQLKAHAVKWEALSELGAMCPS